MRRSVWLGFVATSLLISPSCSFSSDSSTPDAMPDAMPPPCEFRDTTVCVNLEGAVERIFAVDGEINTDSGAECAQYPQVAKDSPYCIVAGSTISVAPAVVLRAVGTRPLVLAATGDISVEGTIDVSSRRASSAAAMDESLGAAATSKECGMFGRDSQGLVEGGGGGAGASFGAEGGQGGDGNYENDLMRAQGGLPNALIPMPMMLRGGCRGQKGGGSSAIGTDGGAGGPPGGAVYLVSKKAISIKPTGRIAANGGGGLGGGVQAGGGGGGSGGLIVLEAPGVVRNGTLSANGGGGGEGGVFDAGTAMPLIGIAGADGAIGTSSAIGGNQTASPSRGGDGGARSRPAGEFGTFSDESGGAGGGGVGYIRIIGAAPASGAVESPVPMISN